MANLKEAIDYAAQNPTSDFATQLKYRIQSGAADQEATSLGIDLTSIKNHIAPVQTSKSDKISGIVDTSAGLKEPRTFLEEALPSLFATGGAIIGGMVGAAGGPPGVAVGGIAGATGGGALGETIQQWIEEKTGKRQELDKEQIVKTAGISGGLQAVFPLGGVAISKIGMNKELMLSAMKKLSGYADDVVEEALKRGPGAISGVKEGESALTNIIKNTNQKLQQYALDTIKTTKEKIAQLTKLSGGGPGFPGTQRSIIDEGRKFASNITNILRTQFKIGVDKSGILNFARSSIPSNIVAGSDQKAIQDAFNLMKSIEKDATIKNIDAILERMMVLRSKTPVGTPTGGETRRIIGQMMDETVKFVEGLGSVSKAYPEYGNFLKENLPVRVFINEAKGLFGSTKNLTAKQISQISTQVLGLFNQGKGELRQFVGKVGEKMGEDVVGAGAGTIIKSGEPISVRAPNLSTRGAVEKILEYFPRKAITNYIKTGKMTGELTDILDSPSFKKILTGLNLTGKTLLQEMGNILQEKTTGEEFKS